MKWEIKDNYTLVCEYFNLKLGESIALHSSQVS